YLREDMATGEIRLSILWEWVHKGAEFTEDDPETGVKAGDVFKSKLLRQLIDEEYRKLLKADTKDVYDESKKTTLPIAREIAVTYLNNEFKIPWFIDLLNINLNNSDLQIARHRISQYLSKLKITGKRITENLDFVLQD